MRSRRSITLIFFFLTSMLLLVHAILPHYHHDQKICFTSETQCTDVIESGNNTKCCNIHLHQEEHQHQLLDDCDLKNIVLRQDKSLDNELLPSLDSLSVLYILCSLNTFFLEAPEFGIKHQEKPYLNNYTPTFQGLSLGLRAPPLFSFLA